MIPKDQFRLALIEDDPHDLFFVKRALTKAGFPQPVCEARDGASALDFFQSVETASDRWPHIVAMDLQMPRMNGDEVLRWLRGHELYRKLPVIILSSSDEPSDLKKTSRLGILKFVTKDVHCDKLVETLEKFRSES